MHLSALLDFLGKTLVLAFAASCAMIGDRPRLPAQRFALAGGMAALAGLATLVALVVTPRLRDPLGGAELALALPTRGLFLTAGTAGLWSALFV